MVGNAHAEGPGAASRPRRWRWVALGLGGLLALLVALFLIARAPCFQLVGEVVCRVDTTERIVALSFDDGPTVQGVDAVLAELEPRGIPVASTLGGGYGNDPREIAARHAAAMLEMAAENACWPCPSGTKPALPLCS